MAETAARPDEGAPPLLRPSKSLYSRIASDDRLGGLLRRMFLVSTACSAGYGFCMGFYHSLAQACSAAVKMPVLLFLTQIITLPALHGFQLFLGGRFRVRQTIAMAMIGTSAMSLLMASLAPIAVFFMLVSSQYDFLLPMHVALMGVAGVCGLIAVHRCHSSSEKEEAMLAFGESGKWMIAIWMVAYMFVGTQLAYMLSPFLGMRGQPFVLVGENPDNFYAHVYSCLLHLRRAGR